MRILDIHAVPWGDQLSRIRALNSIKLNVRNVHGMGPTKQISVRVNENESKIFVNSSILLSVTSGIIQIGYVHTDS